MNARQTQNPLFLRALLEELRMHGVFEEINAKIAFYLAAQDVAQLYEKILARLENVHFFHSFSLMSKVIHMYRVTLVNCILKMHNFQTYTFTKACPYLASQIISFQYRIMKRNIQD